MLVWHISLFCLFEDNFSCLQHWRYRHCWCSHFLHFSLYSNIIFHVCSIGNFFFAGARIFFQSLDAAIFLFSRVSEIPRESLVLPVISTNDRLTLGCELWVLWSFSTFNYVLLTVIT